MRDREKLREALTSVLAAFFLMLLKLGAGLVSGSLAILAEAANSALDIFASMVTYVAIHYADRPADESHHYGHGKAENLSAFVQSGLMLVTCGWITWEALRRLLVAPVTITPSIWPFGVMLVSVVISLVRVRALRRAASVHHSQALEADALHFYTDIYTGVAVLIGLGAVWLSQQVALPFLARADAVAALLVVGLLLRMTLRMGLHAVDVLLDRSHELTDVIAETAESVPGVERVQEVRTRQAGSQSFVDMRIAVARMSSFEESHAIATAVEKAVDQLLHRADVVVHVDPVQPADESMLQAIHAVARREGFAIHHISLHDVAGRVVANLHLELPPALSLVEAHKRADQFEQILLRDLAELSEVVTHIEPISERVERGPDVTAHAATLVERVERLVEAQPEIVDCHDVAVQRVGPEHHVSLHCTFDRRTPLRQVHQVMARIERRLRAEIPSLGHVVIHPEPQEEAKLEED